MIHILIGKSASGKDTILNKLVNGQKIKNIEVSGQVFPIVSYTTRPMREGEIDGKDYNFVTKKEFEELIKNNKLLEYRSYNTLVNDIPDVWFYGTPLLDMKEIREKDWVAIVDIDGCKAFLEKFSGPYCKVYDIVACDRTRTKRAKKRGSFNKCEWKRRLKDDKIKFNDERIDMIRELSMDNFTIINNDTFINRLIWRINKYVLTFFKMFAILGIIVWIILIVVSYHYTKKYEITSAQIEEKQLNEVVDCISDNEITYTDYHFTDNSEEFSLVQLFSSIPSYNKTLTIKYIDDNGDEVTKDIEGIRFIVCEETSPDKKYHITIINKMCYIYKPAEDYSDIKDKADFSSK